MESPQNRKNIIIINIIIKKIKFIKSKLLVVDNKETINSTIPKLTRKNVKLILSIKNLFSENSEQKTKF